ncbi:alpha beta hydrolase domain-containing protein [Rhizopogon vinicolor AM-OR11-026]|uniref:Alpha beta hydrolase domain-containing protein n=1 Tax=Rhizopogon vinicolor AM-OR11-026 TaxID=1314800 RepID=A0A1B7MTM5_9AGAM|nr:alpha beta hydrolase domain-containing protein [Rhizopogon vinicolor AM-OR11-026]
MAITIRRDETAIPSINLRTLAAFVPILDERKADIEKIDRKTFVYNDTRNSRNELDVYYPLNPTLTKDGKIPILVFVYGGGFNTGSRQFPEPYSMGYRALGSFYAHRGFITVIPDYRLVPEVHFPAASEDIRDAVNWIFNNVDTISTPTMPSPDVDDIFIMGHSAGDVHTKVLALYPPLRDTTQPRFKGLIWCAGPWFLDIEGERFHIEGPTQQYFGSQVQQKEREPRALWNGLSDEEIKNLPDILPVRAEREPRSLLITWGEMLSDIEKRRGEMPQTIISKGHNHISPNWALGSGEGEEWGEEVVKWMKARLD